jgi:predicted nucleotidyltransferase
MKYKFLLNKNRKKILETAARYGASNVRVFGSVARGTEDEVSDIDFLVNLAPDRSLFDLGGLLYELRQILGVEVDVVTEDGLRARIRETVLSEAVEL